MPSVEINLIAVVASAVAGFVFGAVYYGVLGTPWMKALGITDRPQPGAGVFVIAFICQFAMAGFLALLHGTFGDLSFADALKVTVLACIGLIVAPMVVNHRFQSQTWMLTVIDAGHWLGVLTVMTLVQTLL